MSMKPLNEVSADFLREITAEECGDTILAVGLSKSGDKFFVELYDEHLDSAGVKHYHSPSSWYASRFVETRFKHGFRRVIRAGATYPQYEVAISDYSVSLFACWKGKKEFRDSAKPYFAKIFFRELKAELNAKRSQAFRESVTIPTDEWFDSHDKYLLSRGITLSPYQKVAAYNSCQTEAYAFFCDPGTGKTAMMLRKLDYVIEHAKKSTLNLVLCPKNCRTNWEREIGKFSRNTDNIEILFLSGANSTDRTINFATSYAKASGKHVVLICGYENFVTTPNLHALQWDLVMCDESHNCANPSTRRTKSLVEFAKNVKNRVIATGTPFRNSPFDIFSQFEFLGTGYSGFDSFASFKEFFGRYGAPNAYNQQRQLVGFENIPLLQERMAKHAFVIRKEEALPFLPKKTFSIKTCEMGPSQKKTYIQLLNMLMAEIDSYGDNPDTITVNNILTQMLRLAQITSGYCPTDAGELNRFDENPKLELLVDCLKGSSDSDDEGSPGVLSDKNRKAIVWCTFKENIKMIRARLELEGIKCVTFDGSSSLLEKDNAVDSFNNDRSVQVFIGIAASGGVGLNLVGFDSTCADEYETNATDVFFYSSNWSSVQRLQAMDRAHRHNTRVPVHVTDLLCEHSIDTEILDRVEGKIEMSLSMQDLKNILLKFR